MIYLSLYMCRLTILLDLNDILVLNFKKIIINVYNNLLTGSFNSQIGFRFL